MADEPNWFAQHSPGMHTQTGPLEGPDAASLIMTTKGKLLEMLGSVNGPKVIAQIENMNGGWQAFINQDKKAQTATLDTVFKAPSLAGLKPQEASIETVITDLRANFANMGNMPVIKGGSLTTR